MNREKRIIEIVENLDYEVLKKFANILGEIVNVEDNKDFHGILKLIDDFQELESTVKGVPIY